MRKFKKFQRIPFSDRERSLVYNYLTNGENATEAVIKSGYSPNTANQNAWALLNKSKIKSEINRLRPIIRQEMEKMATDEVLVTVKWKMEKLKEIVERCMAGDADKDGKLHPSGAIGAISELNKMQGHYSPDKVLTTNVNADLEKDQVDELLDLYKKEF